MFHAETSRRSRHLQEEYMLSLLLELRSVRYETQMPIEEVTLILSASISRYGPLFPVDMENRFNYLVLPPVQRAVFCCESYAA